VPHQVQIGVLPDIKRDGFCFTDGVGLISKQMAEYVARNMGYTNASAF
jgi:hypothetical protein